MSEAADIERLRTENEHLRRHIWSLQNGKKKLVASLQKRDHDISCLKAEAAFKLLDHTFNHKKFERYVKQAYKDGQENERAKIVAYLRVYGYFDAAEIEAGEHLK
jgi:hypothetical protein